MFIVGFVIFSAYMYLMIWNIFYSARKQREENYPDLNGMGNTINSGVGSKERFKIEPQKKKRKRKIKN